jgi:hypothetical protein
MHVPSGRVIGEERLETRPHHDGMTASLGAAKHVSEGIPVRPHL